MKLLRFATLLAAILSSMCQTALANSQGKESLWDALTGKVMLGQDGDNVYLGLCNHTNDVIAVTVIYKDRAGASKTLPTNPLEPLGSATCDAQAIPKKWFDSHFPANVSISILSGSTTTNLTLIVTTPGSAVFIGDKNYCQHIFVPTPDPVDPSKNSSSFICKAV